MTTTTLVEALLHALKDRGATGVFGIPGDFALAMFKVIEESGVLPLHTLSHEPAVGFAADAAARFTSGLGVAAVTYGAGAFNVVNAVAGAYAEKSPVVVVSGAPGAHEGRSGLLLHHQGRTLETQYRVFAEITCAQARLDDPARAPAEIARVLKAAREQSRPVYIEVPRDVVRAPCGPVGPDPASPVDPGAVAACADEVAGLLRAAKRPVLMVGVEVRRYGLEDRVADLARALGLPVVTSFLGRGLLAGHDEVPLAGTYLGAAGDPAVAKLVEESDGLILLGVILSDTNFGVSAGRVNLRRTIHALDRQVTLGYHVYPDLPLAALIDGLLARAGAGRKHRPVLVPKYPHGLAADGERVTPNDIARAVNDLFGR
ncbi:MAG TPA: indolepyruvate/phenylpyruvate decarboxylase, partial [Geminicoccaceae bacterium]|nr:indolepyruvate/phenylpyruvate decarboxylase [Geminicoccaceae bacterium]